MDDNCIGIISAPIIQWIKKTIKDKGGINVDDDIKSVSKVIGKNLSVLAFTKELRSKGLSYNKEKKVWS